MNETILELAELTQENPIYGLYLIVAILAIIFVFIWLWQLMFQRRDPLPDKISGCIWHTKVKKLERIYDGDTFFAHIKGHSPIDKKPVGIRIRGIDTPEMKDKNPKIKKKAQKAKELATQELENARTIHLYNVNTKDKYGRLLATVFCDRRDLAKILIEEKLAKAYDGGKKSEW